MIINPKKGEVMQKSTLEAVGLRTNYDIPAGEIFACTFDYGKYGLDEKAKRTIRSLRDFVQEYNREIPVDARIAVTDSGKAAGLMRLRLRGLDHEEAWAVFLDAGMRTIASRCLTTGSLDATIIDRRQLVRYALETNAKAVILYHNHPSGDPQPSAQDIKQTEDLRNALGVFDVSLADHLVLCDSKYFSFANGGSSRYDSHER